MVDFVVDFTSWGGKKGISTENPAAQGCVGGEGSGRALLVLLGHEGSVRDAHSCTDRQHGRGGQGTDPREAAGPCQPRELARFLLALQVAPSLARLLHPCSTCPLRKAWGPLRRLGPCVALLQSSVTHPRVRPLPTPLFISGRPPAPPQLPSPPATWRGHASLLPVSGATVLCCLGLYPQFGTFCLVLCLF